MCVSCHLVSISNTIIISIHKNLVPVQTSKICGNSSPILDSVSNNSHIHGFKARCGAVDKKGRLCLLEKICPLVDPHGSNLCYPNVNYIAPWTEICVCNTTLGWSLNVKIGNYIFTKKWNTLISFGVR